MSLGILSDPTLPLPILLDTVRHSETGHLSLDQARTARSRAGAIGPYQFLERFLPEFGYGMPTDIPVADVQDPDRARELAGQYITGYSLHHNFTTPLQKLVAYNRGPSFAAAWVARGENIDELPLETQQYITRAAEYLTQNQQPNTEEPQMANDTLFGLPFDAEQAGVLASMAQSGNPLAAAALEQMSQEERNRAAAAQAILESAQSAPTSGGVLSTGANASTISPALTTVTSTPAAPRVAITQNSGFSRNPPPTVNRRDQSALSMQPPRGIGLNEYLIRMGAAGLEGSAKGGLEALGAIGRTYGELQDLERSGMAAYQKAMASGKKRPSGNPVSPYNAVVLDTLNDIIPRLDGDTSLFSAEAGFTGSLMRPIPGSPAADFAAKLDTLKANIGFDRLQKMRDESPTGGALGQVSEMELRQLNAALGSLEQSQSPQQLQDNLRRIREHYIRAVSALEAEYAAAGIDISSKIQPMGGSGGQMTGMGVGQSMTIGGQTVTRIK